MASSIRETISAMRICCSPTLVSSSRSSAFIMFPLVSRKSTVVLLADSGARRSCEITPISRSICRMFSSSMTRCCQEISPSVRWRMATPSIIRITTAAPVASRAICRERITESSGERETTVHCAGPAGCVVSRYEVAPKCTCPPEGGCSTSPVSEVVEGSPSWSEGCPHSLR